MDAKAGPPPEVGRQPLQEMPLFGRKKVPSRQIMCAIGVTVLGKLIRANRSRRYHRRWAAHFPQTGAKKSRYDIMIE